ncbi:MAG: hypothetical protein AB1568_13330, partial [Thermodesulfobacteriota bacterium]
MNIASRRLGFLLAVLILVAWSGDARSFLHAPHDQENGISCLSCHQYPFDAWPGYVKDPGNLDDTFRNFLCLGCHDGASSAPKMLLHSANVINGRLAGWTTQCTDCHDPHFQGQLDNHLTDADALYLVKGSIVNVSVDHSDPAHPRSTIGYAGAVNQPGWSDPGKWSAKTTSGRGLIFVADRQHPQATFEVIAATSATITVAGNLYETGYGSTFGIIYGQLIRNRVLLPSGETRQVKFFLTGKGYVDTTANPTTGICQVCHTQTLYWRQDGSNATHNVGVNCSGCHKTAEGFKPFFVSHGTLQETPSCSVCHGSGNDIVAAVHNANCATCHGSSDPLVIEAIATGAPSCINCHGQYFYSHKNADGLHVPAIVTAAGTSCGTGNCHAAAQLIVAGNARHHQACANCHTPEGVLIGSAAGRQGQRPNTCVACHNAGFAATHTTVPSHATFITASGTSCARCHDPQNNRNHLTVTHKGDCANCHSDQGALIGVAAGGKGSCTFCHGSGYFYQHLTVNHSTLVTSVNNNIVPPQPTTCASCHDPSGGADIVQDTHRNRCSLCHDAQGYLKSGPTGSALGGAGNCVNCHGGGYFWSHRIQDHDQLSHGGATCTSCHMPANTPNDIIYFVHRNNCGRCHNLTGGGVLIGSAAGNLGGADCSSCHGSTYFTQHAHVHVMAQDGTDVAQADSQPCSACHGGGDGMFGDFAEVTDLHLGQCATCHEATRFANPNATSGLRVQNVIANGAAHCLSCHVDKAAPAQHGSVDHGASGLGHVTATVLCVACHGNGNPVALHGNRCSACHTVPPALALPGDRNYVDSMARGECIGCHSTYFAGHTHDHGAGGSGSVLPNSQTSPLTANCVGCHTQADPLVGVHAAAGCATCHDLAAGGARIGSAAGSGQCADCHTGYFTGHNHAPHTVAMRIGIDMSGPHECSACHPFSNDWAGIRALHLDSCATCHDATRDISKAGPPQGVTVPQLIAAGPDPAGCLDCHFDNGAPHGGHIPGSFSWEGMCQGCHDQGATDIVRDLHGNTCSFCHQNGSPAATLINSAANAVPGAKPHGCTECHTSAFAGHGHDHAGTVTDIAVCTACHPAGNPLAVHKGNCFNCHDAATGARIAGARGLGDATVNGGNGGSCGDCHGTDFTVVHPATFDHSSRVTLSADCNVCHTAELIDGTARSHGACSTCHLADGGLTGSAAGHTAPSGCKDCHGADFLAIHPATVDHATAVQVAANCDSCHVASPLVDNLDPKAHSSCGLCHDGNGTLIGAAAGKGAANTCADCHGTDFFAVHPATVDHTSLVTLAGACSGCHSATPLYDGNDGYNHSGCGQCHDANGALIGSALGHAGGGDCTVCHGSAGHDSETVHDLRSIDFGGSVTCSSCHTSDTTALGQAGSGTLASQADVDALHGRVTGNNCDLCHRYNAASQANSEGLPLQAAVESAIAGGKAGTAAAGCLVCHDYNGSGHGNIDHAALGKVGASANCVSCHDRNNVADNTTYITLIHNKSGNGCGTCHLNPQGAGPLREPWESIAPNGGTCAACHPAYDADFAAGHQNEDHAVISNIPTCQACHTGTILVGIHGDGVVGDCFNCHTAANDGTLRAGANGWGDASGHVIGTAVDCSGCHSAYFDAHVHGTVGGYVGHTVAQQPTDLAQEAPGLTCDFCHRNDATGQLADMEDIKAVHDVPTNGAGPCATCHNADRDINPDSPTATTVAMVIQAGGAPISCLACHANKATPAVHYADHGLFVSQTPSCVVAGCHAETSLLTGLHDVAKCYTCHDDVRAPVTLTGSAAGHRVPEDGAQNECSTCHATVSTHDADLAHDMLAMAPNCTLNCHSHPGSTFSEILATHLGNCQTCHGSGYQKVKNAIANGRSRSGAPVAVDCQTCHPTVGTVQHETGHNNMSSTEFILRDCKGCHSSSNFNGFYTVHLNSCNSCHAYTADGACLPAEPGCVYDGTIAAEVQAAIAAGMAGTQVVKCEDCHHYNLIPLPAPHSMVKPPHDPFDEPPPDCTICHISPWSGHMDNLTASPLCANCHYSPDPGATGVIHIMDVQGLGESAMCIKCHTSSRQQVKDAIVNGIAGIPQDCTDCHGVKNTLYHPVPPTDLNHDMIGVVAGCDACHPDAGMAEIYQTHRSDCELCHLSPRQVVKDAIAAGHSLNAVPVAVDCATCHPVDHQQADGHLLSLGASSCDSCHGSLTTPAAIVALHDAPTNGPGSCTTCHDSARPAVASAILAGAATDCAACHGSIVTDYANHAVKDHNGVAATPTCVSLCHAGGIIVAVHNNSCDHCHAPTTGVFKAGDNGNGTAVGGSGDCQSCHAAYFAGHSHSHAASVTATPLCVTCHTGDGVVDVHRNACAVCHEANGARRAGPHGDATVNSGSGGSCAECHTAYFAGHTHSHASSVADTAACVACHQAGDPMGVHKNNCWHCHDSVTGARIVGANGKGDATVNGGSGGTCADCHGTTFLTIHPVTVDHSGLVTLAGACSGCHSATPLYDANDGYTHSGCGQCHDGDGGLIGSAAGHAGGGDCTVCHGAAGHDSALVHNYRSIDYGTGAQCDVCHTSDAAVLGAPGTGTLASQSDIDALHSRVTGNACDLCHRYNAATQANTEGLPLAATVTNAIAGGKAGLADA